MEIILYIICLLLLLRYVFVLYKYLKTGVFKKKVYKGNSIGVIAYSFLTVFIICFLLLMILVSKDKSSDLLMWILFISGFGTFIMYPCVWQQRLYDSAEIKRKEYAKIMNEKFNNKYGNEEYDEIKFEYFNIFADTVVDKQFNSLISMITNNQISFIHPNQYKNITDLFSSLYQQDYVKLLYESESIDLICEKVNNLLKKNNIDFNINSIDVTKNDDEYIKARRKDFISTMIYDLCKIDEIIKSSLNDYELLVVNIYNKEGEIDYLVHSYLCVVQKLKYDDYFKENIVEVSDDENE